MNNIGAALESLLDKDAFRKRRATIWEQNVDYWLAGPLRHVVDIGDYIVGRAERICLESQREKPVVVDMGCGDAWLLRNLLDRRKVRPVYFGLDAVQKFVEHGHSAFPHEEHVHFELADLERPMVREFDADLVVNMFNFLELCELEEAFANASRFLRTGGVLQVATIDKTYLLLAISVNWEDFIKKLALYASLPGIKYSFQPIDLGNGISEALFYPSVLYSTEDYLAAATANGLDLVTYGEHVFTGAHVPKIYNYFEFRKA